LKGSRNQPPGGFCAIIVALLAGGCIQESSTDRDAVGPAGPRCSGDGDCTKFANACNLSVCVNRACEFEPVVCNDDNACTNDRCDEVAGCVFEARPAGSDCTLGESEVCVGSSWHHKDACDDAGHCVDGAVQACLPETGTGVACLHNECVSGVGCARVADRDGTSCVLGGRSDTCIESVRYESDACGAGVCVDGGSTPCSAGYCEVALCQGNECAVEPIGVDIDITGGWNLFELGNASSGAAVGVVTGAVIATRTGIILGADGGVEVQGMLGTLGAVAPLNGSYCVATDGSLQLALHFAGSKRVMLGRVTRGRDLAVMTVAMAGAPDGIAVLVRNRELSEAKLLGGTYRIVGLDNVVVEGSAHIDALLGSLTITAQCITGGSYDLGTTQTSVGLALPNPPSCVEFGGLNAVSFDVRATGDVHVWAGVVGTGGNYAVLQRFRVGERIVEPSLLFLVRQGLAQPAALAGDYATTRVEIDDAVELIQSDIAFDGLGSITSFSEGDIVLGPSDVGTSFVATSEPIGSLFTTLKIGAFERTRVGQVGKVTAGKVDWFVDVGTLPDIGTSNGPVVGRTLQIGVRQP